MKLRRAHRTAWLLPPCAGLPCSVCACSPRPGPQPVPGYGSRSEERQRELSTTHKLQRKHRLSLRADLTGKTKAPQSWGERPSFAPSCFPLKRQLSGYEGKNLLIANSGSFGSQTGRLLLVGIAVNHARDRDSSWQEGLFPKQSMNQTMKTFHELVN